MCFTRVRRLRSMKTKAFNLILRESFEIQFWQLDEILQGNLIDFEIENLAFIFILGCLI